MVVINGEGTLHHGAPEGARLLQAADYAAALGKPVALVNTIYQDNPQDWARRAGSVAYMAARDLRSWASARDAGFKVDYAPDLSFHDCRNSPGAEVRDAVAYGDSVYRDVTRRLFQAYRRAKGHKLYLPIRTRVKHAGTSWPLTLKQRYENLRYEIASSVRQFPRFDIRLTSTAEEYERCLSRVGLYVTGRYHAVCFAMLTRTPFRAVRSNSHKIEALIEEAGINPMRVAESIDELVDSDPADWRYSRKEQANLDAFLADARHKIDAVLEKIAALAR